MTYSVWVHTVTRQYLQRWNRTFNSRQAARQAARRHGLIAFHVLRDRDALPLERPKRRKGK